MARRLASSTSMNIEHAAEPCPAGLARNLSAAIAMRQTLYPSPVSVMCCIRTILQLLAPGAEATDPYSLNRSQPEIHSEYKDSIQKSHLNHLDPG